MLPRHFVVKLMIEILKTTDNKLVELGINEAQSGSWFNLIDPTYDEIQKVSLILNLDESFLRNSLDVDERSRIEIEDDCLLIITNIPLMEDEGAYDTLPLGIIFTDRDFITVSSKKNNVISSFNNFIDSNVVLYSGLSSLFTSILIA